MGKEGSTTSTPEKVVQEIRGNTRRRFSAEEKTRIVLEGLRGEDSIATLCRKEGLAPNLYYRWSKEFLEAGKKRLVGDTSREATSTEVVALRKENARLKQLVAETVLENHLLKKTGTAAESDDDASAWRRPGSERRSGSSRSPTCRCAGRCARSRSRPRRSTGGIGGSRKPGWTASSRARRPPGATGIASRRRSGSASSISRSPHRSARHGSSRG